MVVDPAGAAWHLYTYDPFGTVLEHLAAPSAPANPFLFTGQWYDAEIGQYHLRARQYDQALMRFTTRDPVTGGFEDPLTLHRYLYCVNDPVNFTDNIHDPRYGMWVDPKWHAENSSRINAAWQAFINSNPTATIAQIEAAAIRIAANFGIPSFINCFKSKGG